MYLALALRAIKATAHLHKNDKRRPDFHMLAEEMLELSLSLRGQREHPAWTELIQIGSIVANWLADMPISEEVVDYIATSEAFHM